MVLLKKSLGQNFLKDKNIIKKIVNLVEIKNKNIVEIGAGNGALTDKILEKKPKSLVLVEKDDYFAKKLTNKYLEHKNITIINSDILRINLNELLKKETIIFGNLPYNISSQILVKILKFRNLPKKYNGIIFMFQKELGEKILGKYPSEHYGRLSILSNYKLEIKSKFIVSPNCFFPKPKVYSMVIHFEPKKKLEFKIKDINNLEKITNIFFSKKRKMINKSLKKILNKTKINSFKNLNVNLRPADLKPEIYYKITELFERN